MPLGSGGAGHVLPKKRELLLVDLACVHKVVIRGILITRFKVVIFILRIFRILKWRRESDLSCRFPFALRWRTWPCHKKLATFVPFLRPRRVTIVGVIGIIADTAPFSWGYLDGWSVTRRLQQWTPKGNAINQVFAIRGDLVTAANASPLQVV